LSFTSKVLTASGRAMLVALVAGQRDPQVLAELAKGRMRPKIPSCATHWRAASASTTR
jgi:hypothetical protein